MSNPYTFAWRLAIFSFICAAATGALMRYGMFAGLPGGLLLGDVRHAHSHLMFFSWVTPALILLATEAVRRAGLEFRAGPWCAIAAAVAGLLAYLPFLLSGYRLLPIGNSAGLPLSMMASGLNGAAWYAFALLYLRATWRRPRTVSLRFMDGALVLLVLSSLGAVLLALGGMTDTATSRQMDAYVDMFLTLFADGWFGLGVLGALALTVFEPASAAARRLGVAAMALTLGLALRTVARLLVDAYGLAALTTLESGGGLIAAAAWLFVAGSLVFSGRRSTPDVGASEQVTPRIDLVTRRVAELVLVLIAIKAVFEVVIAFPAGEAFVAREGLRILLLHAFLLGAVSLAVAASMRALLGKAAWRGLGWFALSIGVMLACLVPLTGLWPAALAGPWALRAAFYSSFGPAMVALAALFTLTRSSALKQTADAQRPAPGTPRSRAPEPSGPPA